jgi:hypothetical protein
MKTINKTASVKVMLSYDYCHFEASMQIENEDGLQLSEIDEARKNCNRLANKAVDQYRIYKEIAMKRSNCEYDKGYFEQQCKLIFAKKEGDRTIKEIAMLKQYQDEDWQKQFDYNYDFKDDDNNLPF